MNLVEIPAHWMGTKEFKDEDEVDTTYTMFIVGRNKYEIYKKQDGSKKLLAQVEGINYHSALRAFLDLGST
jgi:hypothetical protein